MLMNYYYFACIVVIIVIILLLFLLLLLYKKRRRSPRGRSRAKAVGGPVIATIVVHRNWRGYVPPAYYIPSFLFLGIIFWPGISVRLQGDVYGRLGDIYYIYTLTHVCAPGTHLSNDVRFNADTVATGICATYVRV